MIWSRQDMQRFRCHNVAGKPKARWSLFHTAERELYWPCLATHPLQDTGWKSWYQAWDTCSSRMQLRGWVFYSFLQHCPGPMPVLLASCLSTGHTVRVIQEERTSTEKGPLSDWPVSKYVGALPWLSIDVKGSTPLWPVPPLGRWAWEVADHELGIRSGKAFL